MTHNSEKHHRHSLRLPSYDYSQPGAYFVTLCTKGRECVLDDPVVSGIITDVWYALPQWFANVDLDEFVVMPNHVHLVVWLYPPGAGAVPGAGVMHGAGAVPGAGASPAPTRDGNWRIPAPERINLAPTIGDVIGVFKSLVFKVYLDWILAHDPERRAKFWQRNYYEHIIAGEAELGAIRRYIRENPLRWAFDLDNPQTRQSFPVNAEEYLADVHHPGEYS